jgi:HK97 family phage major capsid protein
MTITLTRQVSVARMTEIHERITELSDKHRLSKADNEEFARITEEFQELEDHVAHLDRAASIAGAVGGGAGALRVEQGMGDPYARERGYSAQLTGSPARDSALRQLERSVKAGLPARAAETCERLVDTGPDHERSWAARWVTDTGDPQYRSAFAKLVMYGPERAGLEWSAAERDAYDRVSRLKQEQRAMSLTDSAGGYLVPFELDPTVIITSAGSTNPLLQISRVVTSVSDIWHGVTSSSVQASWDAEGAEVSDDSPPFAEPTIPNYKGAAWIPYSIELAGDAPTLMTELGRLLQDGMLQLLNAALTTGSGVGQPTATVTTLLGGSSVVASATADTIVPGDVYKVQSALGPRWQPNARWAANLAILNVLRQLTTGGQFVFPELRTSEPTLAGKPVHELSNMDGTLSGGVGNNAALLYGDFNNFVISQRIGSSVEFVPMLFGPNQRPTGQRGLYLWSRYGSDSVNDAAFRLLLA